MFAAAILLSLLAEAGQIAAPAPAPQAVRVDPANSVAGRALARLYMPADTLIDAELAAFDTQFATQIAKNPDVAALEAKAPGSIQAMAAAMRPLVKEVQSRNIAQVQIQIGDLFARRLNAQEIAELTAFYQSPDVRSAFRKIAMGVDVSETVEKAALDPSYEVQSSDLQRNIETGVANGGGQLTAAEKAALGALEKKPVYQKLGELDPEIEAIVLASRNREDPETSGRLQQVMQKALQDHMAKASGGTQ